MSKAVKLALLVAILLVVTFGEGVRFLLYAILALFIASGLCLTFAVIATIYALRTLEKCHDFLYFAWDLAHYNETLDEYGKEGTE